MNHESLLSLLEAVRDGALPVEHAMRRIGSVGPDVGYVDLGGAKVDIAREERRGVPEVIYCASKRPEEIEPIARVLLERNGLAFGTRCEPAAADYLMERIEGGTYDPLARTILFGEPRSPFTSVVTAVVAAGTSDRPVAEEACRTLETFGAPVDRIYDVGVAGLHRLLGAREQMEKAGVLIVTAGMEGALPSVVGGLFRQPLIAVPTSVGYGAALSGFTALFGMLSSCAGGVTVVNIDNGFGAARGALAILGEIERRRKEG